MSRVRVPLVSARVSTMARNHCPRSLEYALSLRLCASGGVSMVLRRRIRCNGHVPYGGHLQHVRDSGHGRAALTGHSQLSSNQIARATTPPLTACSKREQFRAVPLR
jgi:hypothetical protein